MIGGFASGSEDPSRPIVNPNYSKDLLAVFIIKFFYRPVLLKSISGYNVFSGLFKAL